MMIMKRWSSWSMRQLNTQLCTRTDTSNSMMIILKTSTFVDRDVDKLYNWIDLKPLRSNIMTRMEESLKAFVGIKRTNGILEKPVKNDAQQYGLNISEFAVLELLYNKGPQPINRIQERILIANSS